MPQDKLGYMTHYFFYQNVLRKDYNILFKPNLNFGKTNDKVYSDLTSENPIDLNRYQLLNCHAGRSGLINSGGPSGDNDIAQAIKTAIINKRSGGMGLITGRKAFQKPMKDGIEILNSVQDIYLNKKVTIA